MTTTYIFTRYNKTRKLVLNLLDPWNLEKLWQTTATTRRNFNNQCHLLRLCIRNWFASRTRIAASKDERWCGNSTIWSENLLSTLIKRVYFWKLLISDGNRSAKTTKNGCNEFCKPAIIQDLGICGDVRKPLVWIYGWKTKKKSKFEKHRQCVLNNYFCRDVWLIT